MYITIAMHRLKPGQEAHLYDAIQWRRGAAAGGPGWQWIRALRHREQRVLIGLAVQDSGVAFEAAWPVLREVNADADVTLRKENLAEFLFRFEEPY